jgi:alkane 1-monooxygenase
MRGLRFGVMYGIAAIYLASLWLGGAWLLAIPLVTFGVVPLLDEGLAPDLSEPASDSGLYDLLVRGYGILQLLLLGLTLAVAPGLDGLELFLAALSLGILTGAGGINVAHELMHRTGRGDRALAELLMLSASYPWFCVEHVLGHHRHVGTPRDPATARLGESLYRFVPRSVLGGLRSFWEIERAYAGRRGIRWWSLRDRRTRYGLSLLALYAGLAALGGGLLAGLFLAQSVVAVLLLEITNYLEHYGLSRAEVKPGEYERVKPEHSWNSNHAVAAAFLFNLPRHSDHHAFASRPYHALRPWPEAPELPHSYPAMVLVALVPPLWFRMMDGRVASVTRSSPPGSPTTARPTASR